MKLVEMVVKVYAAVVLMKEFPTDEHLDKLSDCMYELLDAFKAEFSGKAGFVSFGMLDIPATDGYDWEIPIENDIPLEFFLFFAKWFDELNVRLTW